MEHHRQIREAGLQLGITEQPCQQLALLSRPENRQQAGCPSSFHNSGSISRTAELFRPGLHGHDSARLLHAGGEPYSAPLAASIHRAERWYWHAALGRRLDYGPNNPQPQFEQANGIPAINDPLARSNGVVVPGASGYPDRSSWTEFHSTPPLVCEGQQTVASVVRDGDTGEWGVWVAGGTAQWLEAGGSPYRAPATLCVCRAERWYWQTVAGVALPHSDDFPQPDWEQDNGIPDLDDAVRHPQLA